MNVPCKGVKYLDQDLDHDSDNFVACKLDYRESNQIYTPFTQNKLIQIEGKIAIWIEKFCPV